MPFSLSYRDAALAAGLVLLAFALRAIVVFDRAGGDYAFVPPPGSDQLAYVQAARLHSAGLWPDGPFFHQPGIIYYLIGARALSGDSLGMMRLFTALTGALACGWMIGAGWLLTGRRWGGWLAGGLLAVYPVAIFWSTALLIPVLASFYLALLLFVMLWQRQALRLWRSALAGGLLGLLAITRFNLLPVGLACLLLLWWTAGGRGRFARHALLMLGMMGVVIAPVTLWNWQHGSRQLIGGAGFDEIYRGSNRTSDGLRSGNPAMELAQGDYVAALLFDIRYDPLRFIELQAHKAGVYWSDAEPGNNLDYAASGEAVSPLLRAIPLDFRLLAALGLTGLGLLLAEDRRVGIFLLLVNLLIFAGVLAIWVEGRLRQPAVIPLTLTAAYLLVRLPDIMRMRRWRRVLLPAGLTALLLTGAGWAYEGLPVKHPSQALPADVRPLDVVFDDTLRLRGWRVFDQWPAAGWGWTTSSAPYAVELFWETLRPTEKDYNFYLAYVLDDMRYGGHDREIGAMSFRPWPTSRWQPGEIYHEIAGFRFDADDIPTWQNGVIQVGVYVWDEAGKIVNLPVTSTEPPGGQINLQPLAVVDLAQVDAPPAAMTASQLVFGPPEGDQIALLGYALPARGQPAEQAALSFYWQALNNVRGDYNLFIHVMDADDQLAAQYDGLPRAGLLTSTWPHVAPLRADLALTLPETPGLYRVYIGLYDALTHERLPVAAPDNRPLLGEIVVEGG